MTHSKRKIIAERERCSERDREIERESKVYIELTG